jgi:hypothetical protein
LPPRLIRLLPKPLLFIGPPTPFAAGKQPNLIPPESQKLGLSPEL